MGRCFDSGGTIMRVRAVAFGAFALILGLLAGCSSGDTTMDLSDVLVETVVDKTVVNEGESIMVTCVVTKPDGKEVSAATLFTVDPAEGVTLEGKSATFADMGMYAVTCALEDGSRVDESPVQVRVTRNNVATIETILDGTQAVAGDEVGVTCKVTDPSGNEVNVDTFLVLDPEEGIEVEGLTLKTSKAGEFSVACATDDPPLQDESPAILEVKPGKPAKVVAFIEPEEADAGEQVDVLCTVEDEYGNVLEEPAEVDPQEGLVVGKASVKGKVAGDYEITCSPTNDKMPVLEVVADNLKVKAAEPVSLELKASPSKKAYKVKDKVTITGTAKDEFDNPLEGLEVIIEVPEQMVLSGTKYEFKEEGIFLVKGSLAAPYESIKGELTLVCDETGPIIVVTEPERGATLNGETKVAVRGTVIDGLSPTSTLKINDITVPVAADGTFDHVVMAEGGMNMLSMQAMDEYANSAKRVQSFYYSTGWLDYEEKQIDDVLMEKALIIFLGQNFMDDGDHDPAKLDDLATLVEVLLDGLDLNQIIGGGPLVDVPINNVVDYSIGAAGFDFHLDGDLYLKLYVQEVSFAKPSVTIKSRDGGIDLLFGFLGNGEEDPGVFLQLFIQLQFNLTVSTTFGGSELFNAGINPSLFTGITFWIDEISVLAKLDMNKESGQDLTFDIADLNVEIDGIHLEPLSDLVIELGMVNFNGTDIFALPSVQLGQLVSGLNDIITNYVIDPLLNFIIPLAMDLIEPLVEWQVGPLLADLINQFELEIPIPIPGLPGQTEPVEITLKTGLSTVKFSDLGAELSLQAAFWSQKGIDRVILGSILRMNCLGTSPVLPPQFDNGEKFQLAASQDMVNALLFSLYWPGGLTLDLDESVLGAVDLSQFQIKNLTVKTYFYLPPILNDCQAKEMTQLQIGDLMLTPSFKIGSKPLTLKLFISMAAEAVITGAGNEIALKILGISPIDTEVAEVIGDPNAFLGMNIVDLIENLLIPMIVDQVSNLALGSFPIPEIDLSGLLPGIPPGTVLKLGNLEIKMSGGYMVVGGELE